MNESPFIAGDEIRYGIKISNTGSGTATNVIYSDEIYAYTVLIEGSLETDKGAIVEGNQSGDRKITIDIGDIGPKESVHISYRVRISEDVLPDSRISNQGVVSASNHSDEPTDDPTTLLIDDPTVVNVYKSPTVLNPPTGYKTVSGTTNALRWEITWTNENNDEPVFLHAEDQLDTNLQYMEGGANSGDFSFDNQTGTVTWEGYIPPNGEMVSVWIVTKLRDASLNVSNQTCGYWDMDGDGDWQNNTTDAVICTVDPSNGQPLTIWTPPVYDLKPF